MGLLFFSGPQIVETWNSGNSLSRILLLLEGNWALQYGGRLVVTESGVGSPWKVLDYGAGEQSHMIIYVTYGKIRILSPVSSAISKPLVKFHSLC